MNDAPISPKERRKARAMCRDISKQVLFRGRRISPEEWWGFILSGVFGWEMVENPFYGDIPSAPMFVVEPNKRTKDLTVSTGAQLITLLYAFGNNRGVEWSDPKWKAEMAAHAEEARATA